MSFNPRRTHRSTANSVLPASRRTSVAPQHSARQMHSHTSRHDDHVGTAHGGRELGLSRRSTDKIKRGNRTAGLLETCCLSLPRPGKIVCCCPKIEHLDLCRGLPRKRDDPRGDLRRRQRRRRREGERRATRGQETGRLAKQPNFALSKNPHQAGERETCGSLSPSDPEPTNRPFSLGGGENGVDISRRDSAGRRGENAATTGARSQSRGPARPAAQRARVAVAQ